MAVRVRLCFQREEVGRIKCGVDDTCQVRGHGIRAAGHPSGQKRVDSGPSQVSQSRFLRHYLQQGRWLHLFVAR